MGQTDRAFNQVKAILSKLDRSIDEARRRRLDASDPEIEAPPRPAHDAADQRPEAVPRAKAIPIRRAPGV